MTIRSIAVRNLGRIGYARGLEIQKTLQRAQLQRIKQAGDASRNPSMTQAQYQCNDVLDTLLICQHDPVYTIGIRRDGFDEEIEKLKKLNLNCDYYKTSRGGLITFHGPGQLVCYPIINLAHFTKSIRWYIHQLEECLIATCKRFNVAARTTQHTGVWVDDSKIAAIGRWCLIFFFSVKST